MATPDARRVISGMEGYLCLDPSDLTAAYPHGGTAVGYCRDMEFRFGERKRIVASEAFGKGVAMEVFRYQESPVFAAVLRQWDSAAIVATFPDAALGDSGEVVISGRVSTNNARGGQKLSGKAVALCFSPKNLDHDPFIVVYRAIPYVVDTASIEPRLDREVGLAVGFIGIPDSRGWLYETGGRGDLTL